MSRIGKLPIGVPNGITVTIAGQSITVKGPKGELNFQAHKNISVKFNDDTILVARPDDSKENRSLHGTTRAILNNMVKGVKEGFQKKLEVKGVGYRFNISGKKLGLSLGYSHPIDFPIPEGISILADEENKNMMIIQGIDKQLVGETAARIRAFRKPEPYKGKGIRYSDEYVKLKQGKKAAK
ncbi:MAG: 50S ribosomal protein L6 [Candidatus Gracilibacteria bacterium]|nr:50S ribosomal protein L6 [bacterium]MDZ4217054.1 50S ribosomal protein L6 [Candidatus Gracilibacteria bacterium]